MRTHNPIPPFPHRYKIRNVNMSIWERVIAWSMIPNTCVMLFFLITNQHLNVIPMQVMGNGIASLVLAVTAMVKYY